MNREFWRIPLQLRSASAIYFTTEAIMPFSKLTNTTGKHKDWYIPEYLKVLCRAINPGDALFSSQALCRDFKKSYQDLELKERLTCIAELLDNALDCPYSEQLEVLTRAFGPPLESETGMFTDGYYLYPLSQFVELYGKRDLQASLAFICELTQRFTGEWAIRTIAHADEKLTLKTVKGWAENSNFHIRRLASEGLRPRLPWGTKIAWVDQSPRKLLPLYNKLRNDDVLYVRRSVANSMGDIIKIDDSLAYATFEKWLSGRTTVENLWVIKHAIRTPVKKGENKYVALKTKVERLMKA